MITSSKKILWIISVSLLLAACAKEPPPTSSVAASALTAPDVEPFATAAYWSGSSNRGNYGTFITDVTGDGLADIVDLNTADITVYRSNATYFGSAETWSSTAFKGDQGTYFADVTGDGVADAVEVNNTGILVRPSTGSAFGVAQTWSTTAFYGTVGTFVADLDGDTHADIIAVNSNNIQVRRSTGSGLGSVETWSTAAFLGTGGKNYFADVTGDGLADAIRINASTVTVRRSTGTSFSTTVETWSSSFSGGLLQTAFIDVTGDKTADAVAVDYSGVTMQRSGRWFFGSTTETLTSSLVPASVAPALGDVTGDGRADFLKLSSTQGTQVQVRQSRTIPLRIVQLVSDCSYAVPDSTIAMQLDRANQIYREAGLAFAPQPVSQNPDCPGQGTSSHIVNDANLSYVRNPPVSQTELVRAIPFNPTCNMGYNDFPTVDFGSQEWWLAARCALPGEVLIISNAVGTNGSNSPGDGNLIALDIGTLANPYGNLPHELGHYLGLPHTFDWDRTAGPLGYIDPTTGQGSAASVFWDLATANGQFFSSKAAAAANEMQLTPIDWGGGGNGWWCGAPDYPACPFTNPPLMTLAMPVAANMSNVIYTYLPQTTTFDWRMQGLQPRAADNLPTYNVMSYGYQEGPPTTRNPGLSLSQIYAIQNNLKTDVQTKYLDATGHVIFGRRPLLGITGPAPQTTYMQADGCCAAPGTGTLASNGPNTWLIAYWGTLYSWNYRTRTWTNLPGNAKQVAAPPDGTANPWIISGSLPGPVQRWNGSAFANLPGDPSGQACVNNIAIASPTSAWAISCYGPNSDGNYAIAKYTDAAGWSFGGVAGGWAAQVVTTSDGVPWIKTLYNGGSAAMINRGVLDANGNVTQWVPAPPPSGVIPQYLAAGANIGIYLPPNFLGNDNHIYVYNAASSAWVDSGAPPQFPVAQITGALPHLWLTGTGTTQAMYYAR